MTSLSRQDVQTVVDMARNRILEKVLSRQEMQNLFDLNRDRLMTNLQNLHSQDQRLLAQQSWQVNQNTNRVMQVEARMLAIEQQLKSLQQLLVKFMQEQQSQTSHTSYMLSAISHNTPQSEKQVAPQPIAGLVG